MNTADATELDQLIRDNPNWMRDYPDLYRTLNPVRYCVCMSVSVCVCVSICVCVYVCDPNWIRDYPDLYRTLNPVR